MRELVVAAVRSRVGADAEVSVEAIEPSVTPGTVPTLARVEPGARLGRPSRFRLLAGDRQAGFAIATCRVRVAHARAVAAIAAGMSLTAGMIDTSDGDPGDVLLAPLPRAADAIGARVVRAIGQGETLLFPLLRTPFAVRSGARVEILAHVGGVEARATATALQSGRMGDLILVVTPARRQVRVRIIGQSTGEVVHGS